MRQPGLNEKTLKKYEIPLIDDEWNRETKLSHLQLLVFERFKAGYIMSESNLITKIRNVDAYYQLKESVPFGADFVT